MSGWKIDEMAGGVTFAVRVIPRSSRNQIAGVQGDALRVKLAAPPVEGAANEALIGFLAERLGVRKSAVSIISGERNRSKTVRVDGVTRERVERVLLTGDLV
ncbi:MAG TPA: DUF167 domain-containing protein [Anaerolineae bacterium]|nr:DUF167 domain-containing protein [Anaerolineae bacterium]